MSFVWNAPTYGLHELYVVVDDDGTGKGAIRESNETNNTAKSAHFIGEPPVADAGADQLVVPGSAVTLDGSGSFDPAGYTPLTYLWQLVSVPEDSSAVLDDANSVTPAFVADLPGTYVAQLVVENSEGIQSAVAQASITTRGNQAPTIISTPETIAVTNVTYMYQVRATDPDDDPLDYQLLQAPQGMVIDSLSGALQWSPSNGQTGEQEIVVQAADPFGGTDTQHYTIRILVVNNRPPIITSNPETRVVEGQNYLYDVEAKDLENDILLYKLIEAPADMTIVHDTGMISWNPEVLFQEKITFFDDQFNPDDWESVVSFSTNTGGSATMSQRNSGGNTENYAFFDVQINSASGSTATSAVHTFVRKTNAVYSPQLEGAILYLDYSHDVLGPHTWRGGVALRQNGAIYWHQISSNSSSSSWMYKEALRLTERDFHLWTLGANYPEETPKNPDFSAQGDPLEFGVLFGSNNGPGAGAGRTTSGIDNWSVQMTPVNSVPVTVEVSDELGGLDRQQFVIYSHHASHIEGFVFNDYNKNGQWDRRSDVLVATPRGLLRFHTNGALLTPEVQQYASYSTLGPDGALYYTQWANSIKRYVPTTGKISIFSSGEHLKMATGLEFSPNGDLYVTDTALHKIVRIDGQTGQHIRSLNGNIPTDLTFDSQGDLYVCNAEGGGIYRYSAQNDTYKGEFASYPCDNGNISFGPDGHLYVASWYRRNVTRFHGTTGGSLGEFVSSGNAGLGRIHGLAFDEQGDLYACDIDNGRILRYKGTTGEFLGTFITLEDAQEVFNLEFISLSTDPEEPPLSEWTVYLDLNRNERHDQFEPVSTTNAQGHYTFHNLPAGEYSIVEQVHPGWIRTSPVQSAHEVEVPPEETTYQVYFGNSVNGLGNMPPEIVSTPIITTSAWNEYLYDVRAVDHNGDPLTYTLLQAPEGMSVKAESGMIVWTATDTDIGEQEVSVQVSDGNGGSDEQTFTLTVTASTNQAPFVTSIPLRSVSSGIDYLYQIEASDPDGDPLSYALAQAPQGMTVSPQGTFYWTDDGQRQFPAEVVVLISDGRGRVTSHAWTITSNVPPAVVLTAPTDGAAYILNSSILVQAEATDEDGSVSRVAFYQGSTLLGEDADAPYEYLWQHVAPGEYQLRAVAYDNEGASAESAVVTITVAFPENHQPQITSEPTYSAPIGELYQYDVEATDPNGDTLTYSLEYGPQGMTIDAVSGLITWTPTAAQSGQHQFRVVVEDGRGAGAGQTVDCFVPEPNNTAPRSPRNRSLPPGSASSICTMSTPQMRTAIR